MPDSYMMPIAEYLEQRQKIKDLTKENIEQKEYILQLERKPVVDWSKAQAWARYHTQDSNGLCEFWEERPVMRGDVWALGVAHSRYLHNFEACPEWANSLVERPRDKTLIEIFKDEVAKAGSLDELRVWLDSLKDDLT